MLRSKQQELVTCNWEIFPTSVRSRQLGTRRRKKTSSDWENVFLTDIQLKIPSRELGPHSRALTFRPEDHWHPDFFRVPSSLESTIKHTGLGWQATFWIGSWAIQWSRQNYINNTILLQRSFSHNIPNQLAIFCFNFALMMMHTPLGARTTK